MAADDGEEDVAELCRLLVVEFWCASSVIAALVVVAVTWCSGTGDGGGLLWRRLLRKRRTRLASEAAVTAMSATEEPSDVPREWTKPLRKLSRSPKGMLCLFLSA